MSKETLKEKQARLKDEFVSYFEHVPVQKYAAMYIGVTEQTIINWMKEDNDFLNRANQARAKWVKKQTIKSKAEFALERLEADVFKERKELEVTIPKPILGGITRDDEDKGTDKSV